MSALDANALTLRNSAKLFGLEDVDIDSPDKQSPFLALDISTAGGVAGILSSMPRQVVQLTGSDENKAPTQPALGTKKGVQL